MDTKDWNAGYAAGYKAGLQRAVAVCKEIRDDYNKHLAGKRHTPVGDMATACASAIHALMDEPVPSSDSA
jgi:hypothetical protein